MERLGTALVIAVAGVVLVLGGCGSDVTTVPVKRASTAAPGGEIASGSPVVPTSLRGGAVIDAALLDAPAPDDDVAATAEPAVAPAPAGASELPPDLVQALSISGGGMPIGEHDALAIVFDEGPDAALPLVVGNGSIVEDTLDAGAAFSPASQAFADSVGLATP